MQNHLAKLPFTHVECGENLCADSGNFHARTEDNHVLLGHAIIIKCLVYYFELGNIRVTKIAQNFTQKRTDFLIH